MRRFLGTVGLAIAVFAAALGAPPAAAEDPITGFFNMIFGGGRQPPPQPPTQAPMPLEAPKKPRPPAEPKIVEAPKNADAQSVLVVGDIEAAGLAVGLQLAFAEEPSLAVVPRTRNTAGLVRDGDADWLAQLPKVLADNKSDFVVAMIGINDWQPIAVSGAKPLDPGSDDWMKLYGDRLDRVVAALKASGRPFWWVGLPPTADTEFGPTRRAAFSAFLSSLNDLARPRVQAAGGTFVDVWAAFTDDEGHYTQMGPDVDGQVKRLRANDGILFTRAGQRKLAFFVETGIMKLKRGESTVAPMPEEQPVQQKPEEVIVGAPPPLPPAPWATVGPVVPLDGGAPSAETTLAGAPDAARPTTFPGGYPVSASPEWLRLVEGRPLDPPAGRVDARVRAAPEAQATAGARPPVVAPQAPAPPPALRPGADAPAAGTPNTGAPTTGAPTGAPTPGAPTTR